MTVASFLARWRRAKRQDAPRVLIMLDVFAPNSDRPSVVLMINGIVRL